ncbi:hypothetical protein Tco_0738767 [Tanacetum coccineum]
MRMMGTYTSATTILFISTYPSSTLTEPAMRLMRATAPFHYHSLTPFRDPPPLLLYLYHYCRRADLFNMANTTLGRDYILTTPRPECDVWRELLLLWSTGGSLTGRCYATRRDVQSFAHVHDALKDLVAAVRAERWVLRIERELLLEQEGLETRQAWAIV